MLFKIRFRITALKLYDSKIEPLFPILLY